MSSNNETKRTCNGSAMGSKRVGWKLYYTCLILLQLGPTRTRAAAEKRKFSPTRTVSFIQTHCSWTSPFHLLISTHRFNARAETIKKKLSKQSISTVRSPFSRLLLFLSTTSGGMLSIPFNAPSDSSSLSFTYPPTRKISKQSTAVDESKPSRQNQKKRSPLFNKRSSSPSLRLGHRRRHSPSLHSRKEVVGKMVKQEKSMDGGRNDERADWKDPKELEAFCRFCAVQVMEGQRKATGFLSKIGVSEVIRQLGEIGKVVTWLQIKNKWDYLRKRWKNYNKCLENETGLGYDPGTGMFDAPDEWWNRKIAACPDAKTFKTHGLPNRELLNIMFGGTVATGKNAFYTSGPIPTETTEGSGDSANSIEFVDPQCEPVVNIDAMEVEGPSSSRAGPTVNKGKGLATSVHIFKPICKKPKKKHSAAQEMSDSLKSISNVIVERSSLSVCTPSAPTATAQIKEILDMVLSLPGVYSGHYLHLFSTIYFMEKEPGRHMFAALSDNKDIQLKWLEKEYQRHPDYHFS